MDEAIYRGRGKGIIVIQDCSPVPEGSISGDHDGATFIAVGDDLKEEFGPLLIHRQIPQLIDDKGSGRGKVIHGFEEGVICEGCGEEVDQIHGGSKACFDPLHTGLIP